MPYEPRDMSFAGMFISIDGGASVLCLTRIRRVLDGQEPGLLVVGPASPSFIIVGTTVPQGDADLLIVEVQAVELEELEHEDPEVLGRVELATPDLRVLLQKANREAHNAVAPKPAGEDLVHGALREEALHDEHERAQRRERADEVVDHVARGHAVQLVDADVDGEAAVRGYELDDRDFGFCNDRHLVGDARAAERIRERVQDGHFIRVEHRV
jgi:hypothetical protein